MRTIWEAETGSLSCNWSELAESVPQKPGWLQDSSRTQSSHLHPAPDFASHSSFGGATWFYPIPLAQAST